MINISILNRAENNVDFRFKKLFIYTREDTYPFKGTLTNKYMENSIVQNKVSKIPTNKVLPNKSQGEKKIDCSKTTKDLQTFYMKYSWVVLI